MNNPLLAMEFCQESNIGVDPQKLSHGSNEILIWKCSNHKTCNEHIWPATPNGRLNGNDCPFCVNHHGEYVCRCNSFMNNPILAEDFCFGINQHLNPWRISKGSYKIINWICKTCSHVWPASVNDRSNKNSGCPKCVSIRTESKGVERIRLFLSESDIEFEQEKSLRGISSRHYDFKFYYNGKWYIIEFDGEKHFYKSNWHKSDEEFRERQYVDKIKTIFSLLHNINILRISNASISRAITEFLKFESDCPFVMYDNVSNYQEINNCVINPEIIKFFCDTDCVDQILTLDPNFKYSSFDLAFNELCNFKI